MENPFTTIETELKEVKHLLHKIISSSSQEDFNKKLYTRKEAAELLKVSVQTIDMHISKGSIKCFQIGDNKKRNRKLIKHEEIFNALGEVKSIKYKR